MGWITEKRTNFTVVKSYSAMQDDIIVLDTGSTFNSISKKDLLMNIHDESYGITVGETLI